MIAPFAFYPLAKYALEVEFPESLLVIVAGSTVVWLAVTFLTRPTLKIRIPNLEPSLWVRIAWPANFTFTVRSGR